MPCLRGMDKDLNLVFFLKSFDLKALDVRRHV